MRPQCRMGQSQPNSALGPVLEQCLCGSLPTRIPIGSRPCHCKQPPGPSHWTAQGQPNDASKLHIVEARLFLMAMQKPPNEPRHVSTHPQNMLFARARGIHLLHLRRQCLHDSCQGGRAQEARRQKLRCPGPGQGHDLHDFATHAGHTVG